ncbi:MAG: methionyl-tRNA formyltransferase, partial [Leptospiraceae bacterium]|nr:methionyl-tRNA formyltransferase [Leptospiraceae bacterium]
MEDKMIKLGYFADGPWSHRALKTLLSDSTINISFICVRYDSRDPVLLKIAAEHGIPALCHSNVNSEEFLREVATFECTMFVSMSFNQIFRRNLYSLPPLKTINCHAGKLPFYRGRNVLNWVLINDESEFGITVHYIDDGVDTGDIILQKTFPITELDTYGSLLERAYGGCSDLLYEAVKQIQQGTARVTRQETVSPWGFYCVGRGPGDELLDWKQTSREVFNFVRALSDPGPRARTLLGDAEIQINAVRYFGDAPVYRGIPGSVVGKDGDTFFVKTLDSFVQVLE